MVVLGVMIILFQLQTQKQLRFENGSLAQHITQLKIEIENLSNRLAAVTDSPSLPDAQLNELLRLRGEVALLRQHTNQLTQLHEENSQLRGQIETAQDPQYQLTPEDKFLLKHQHALVAMTKLESAMYNYAETYGSGRFAANLDQLARSGYLDGVTNLPGNIQWDDFEFINAGRVDNNMPDKIILRLKIPYQNASGKWVREYGLSGGTVTTEYSDDGNFNAFEQQRMVPLPQNRNQ